MNEQYHSKEQRISIHPSVLEMCEKIHTEGLGNVFDRYPPQEKIRCNFCLDGNSCQLCSHGPCRISDKDRSPYYEEAQRAWTQLKSEQHSLLTFFILQILFNTKVSFPVLLQSTAVMFWNALFGDTFLWRAFRLKFLKDKTFGRAIQ